ncbi:cytosine/adenosine deaminase-related metal-dependent hydrolase [Tepidamorphus gemmatus]|uniref:Cytosine/adenosine deaminase-related metal-dependent hydrolase n=2 Tax=Tepidamorphus gemmatus TaxID=747076 RepID=A0A4R3MKY0_9HYPH|nr:cytosine/adenosine deaminase-related metal-dependent hydrolase [Tepidamorphus gemmatus]
MCGICQSTIVSAPGEGSGAAGGAADGPAAPRVRSGPMPAGTGERGRRLLIRGGHVLSLDPDVGDFAVGDVLVNGSRIEAVAPMLDAGDAEILDAAGMIVMPGFVDTHHHQFETALRGFLADGILINDGHPHSAINYYEHVLQKFSLVYRPSDVHINELYGSLAQLDAGVTTVMDVSQIHHSPEHSDAAVQALRDAGRRAVLGYFEGWGDRTKYPDDARRLRSEAFASDDQLLTMAMGGEIYLPGYERAWEIGRELALPIALHVVGTFGMAPIFDELARAGRFGPDNIFIHMTGMSDLGWKAAADAGAHVSLSVPIEMVMRHGMPPIQKALDVGLQPSLSSDVECTMTADPFTQMRAALTLQRAFVNEAALGGGENLPDLLTARDVIRMATLEGARGLKLDHKVGSLTPGKEADIVLLDATAINVAPLNHVPGAVVTLMERSNVDTVMVAGRIRKWRGTLLDVDLDRLRGELEASRDYLFEAAGIDRDLFRA